MSVKSATTHPVPSDIEIAQAATLQPIEAIAEKMGLTRADIEFYGDSMAKVKLEAIERLQDAPQRQVYRGDGDYADAAGRGQIHDHGGAGPSHAAYWQDAPPSPFANRRKGQPLASKAARQGVAIAKWCRWSNLICT